MEPWNIIVTLVSAVLAGALFFVWHGFLPLSGRGRWRIVCVGSIPSLILLALWASLVVHFEFAFRSLPVPNNDRDFSPLLSAHITVAVVYFRMLFLSLCLWPIPFVLCLIFLRFRKVALYLAVSALTTVFSFCLMLFTPCKFQTWWMD